MSKKYYDFIIYVLKIKYNSYLCKNYSLIPTKYIGEEINKISIFFVFI